MTSVLAVSSGGVYVDLTTPAYGGYTSKQNEITKSSRNTLGTLYKFRIAVKGTIEAEWHGLTPEQKSQIISLTDANEFNVRYFDVFSSTFKFGRFYRGDDIEVVPYLKWNGSEFGRYNVKLSFVEF